MIVYSVTLWLDLARQKKRNVVVFVDRLWCLFVLNFQCLFATNKDNKENKRDN